MFCLLSLSFVLLGSDAPKEGEIRQNMGTLGQSPGTIFNSPLGVHVCRVESQSNGCFDFRFDQYGKGKGDACLKTGVIEFKTIAGRFQSQELPE